MKESFTYMKENNLIKPLEKPQTMNGCTQTYLVTHDGTHPITGIRHHIVEGIAGIQIIRNAFCCSLEYFRKL